MVNSWTCVVVQLILCILVACLELRCVVSRLAKSNICMLCFCSLLGVNLGFVLEEQHTQPISTINADMDLWMSIFENAGMSSGIVSL
ncbi:hypothetical protein C8Q72DRAFT_842005 [Fomitopsis betulina]|nr:hypothetical protein C8Q72DRAFT_842005 [Fomitopsis betulina]